MSNVSEGIEGEGEGEEQDENIPSSPVQFWTLTIFQIPSLACTVFLLYYYLRNRQQRQALHNHVVIILLFIVLGIEIIDNPFYIDSFRFYGRANSFPLSPAVCLIWWIFDYGFFGAITVYLAWGSIERHILVFHHRYLRTRRQKLLLHYLPLTFITIYLCGFYLGVIVFPPCENSFDYESVACGISPCYEEVPYLNVWDYFVNGIVCAFIEAIFSILLFIRVILQKRRAHQGTQWKKHRKMAFQLLSISALNLMIVFPQSLITIIQKVGEPDQVAFVALLDPYFFYLSTYVAFLLPIICLISSPEIWQKFILLNVRKRRTAVQAIQIGITANSLTHR